jgi:predicted DNA-binding transcriptional regulator YafY
LLQAHRYWPGPELAGRLGVSLRTVRRDVDRLRDLGYPVQAQRGVDGGYQLTAGAALPPLVLDDEEAVALAVGLLNASQSSVAGMGESSVRALAKVVQVMPKRLRRRVDAVWAMTEPLTWAGRDASVEPEVLTTVAQACRDTERLEFGYTAADCQRTERSTEPHRLVSVGRRWYLVAYDLTRQDWRSFRLDRLSAPLPTGSRFAPRALPATDAAAFVRAGLSRTTASATVEAVVSRRADEVRVRIGRWASVEDRGDGTCSVRIQAESMDWAAIALALTDADFRVQGSPEFVEHLSGWARRLSRASTR